MFDMMPDPKQLLPASEYEALAERLRAGLTPQA
jgi:hypothetical protein